MDFISHRVDRDDLQVGDHIYTWRTGFVYSHHGIYVGGDKVVHFAQAHVKSSHTCSASSFPHCGYRKSGSGVTASCLNCFMESGSLYRYQYGVGWHVLVAKIRAGTCTTAKSDDRRTVIHRAMYLLDNGFGEYNLLKHNCETFALYCKTGLLVKQNPLGASGQVWYAFSTVSLGRFTWYYSDIGVRSDVAKVEVENVAAFLAKR